MKIATRVSLNPGDNLDGMHVKRSLGEGSFGCVYQVEEGGRQYAVKILKMWCLAPKEYELMRKRFENEYKIGMIGSPYLVHNLGYGEVGGNPYIKMEFCSGGSLEKMVKADEGELVRIAHQVLQGLKALHSDGKVHRDLKPQNVLLDDKGNVKITDFGISGDRFNRLSGRKDIMGTYAFMAPEQLNAKNKDHYKLMVLPTIDIFAFGVMMYLMLTGKLPFGEDPLDDDYMKRGAAGEWRKEGITKDWYPFFDGCLQPDYKKRVNNTDEARRLLPNRNVNKAYVPYEEIGTRQYAIGENVMLVEKVGDEVGKVYHLGSLLQDANRHGRNLLFMGRKGEVYNDIAILEADTKFISRRHCTLEYGPSSHCWFLHDGQYRVKCPIGQRVPDAMPCMLCTAHCDPNDKDSHTFVAWPSLNGTFINSHKINPKGEALHVGDVITVGDSTFVVKSESV